MWIRTASSKKRFYVRHPETSEKHFVEQEGAPQGPMVAFFDDHLKHGIVPVDEPAQWSMRVDGRFTAEFRALLVDKGVFGPQSKPTPDDGGNGLRGVLASQQNGPCFLLRENEEEEEVWSDEDEEEEEEEEEEDERDKPGAEASEDVEGPVTEESEQAAAGGAKSDY